LWAAVNEAITSQGRPMIVVYLGEGKAINPDQRRLHERIADHCALDLAYVHRNREDRTPD
jgi:hypothetical protein